MEKLKIVGWAHFDDSYPTKIITQENLSEVIDLVSDEIQKKQVRIFRRTTPNFLNRGSCFFRWHLS